MDASFGLFGKHPTFGDFISQDVPEDVQSGVQGWLDGILASLRDTLGDAWATEWDRANTVRFWVGRGLSRQTLAGILQPSRDSVGRRYPLVALAAGAAIAAPVVDPDQMYFDQLQGLLDAAGPDGDVKSVPAQMAELAQPEDDASRAAGPLIWAHNPDGDLDGLLKAAAPQDKARAVTTRSYWWVKPEDAEAPALWLGQAGFPDAQAMGWLLFGRNITAGGGDV